MAMGGQVEGCGVRDTRCIDIHKELYGFMEGGRFGAKAVWLQSCG